MDARAELERGARERQLGAGALSRERLPDAEDHVDAAAGSLEYVLCVLAPAECTSMSMHEHAYSLTDELNEPDLEQQLVELPLAGAERTASATRTPSPSLVQLPNGTLSLELVNESFAGAYECAAHNGFGRGLSKSVQVEVLCTPAFLLIRVITKQTCFSLLASPPLAHHLQSICECSSMACLPLDRNLPNCLNAYLLCRSTCTFRRQLKDELLGSNWEKCLARMSN